MHSPQQTEDMHRPAANTDGPKLPQEVKSALSLINSISVVSPVQCVVQVNTAVFVLHHHLHFFSHDGNTTLLNPDPLKIYNHLLCFHRIQDEMIPHTMPQSSPPDTNSIGTRSVFYSTRTFFWLRMMLKSCYRIPNSWSAQAFRTLGLTPPGPAALFWFRLSSGFFAC